jgi:hypothetical protein
MSVSVAFLFNFGRTGAAAGGSDGGGALADGFWTKKSSNVSFVAVPVVVLPFLCLDVIVSFDSTPLIKLYPLPIILLWDVFGVDILIKSKKRKGSGNTD